MLHRSPRCDIELPVSHIRAIGMRIQKMGKSGPGSCHVCRHKHRHQIDLGIVAGVSSHVLGARFEISHDSVLRHAANHLSPVQRAALLTAQQPLAIDLDQLRDTESSGLLASLVAQRARLAGYGELAAELGDIAAATRVEGAILANLQTVGKLLQQFVHVHDVRHSSILISPDYLALRQCLVTTLRAFPDAAIAVGRALHKLESDAAMDVTSRAHKPGAPRLIEHSPGPLPFDAPMPPPPACPC
jgi:hypothetical protein